MNTDNLNTVHIPLVCEKEVFMNRLKKELLKRRLYTLSYCDNVNSIECLGSDVKIYSDTFIRVITYYDVLTIDTLIDTHFNDIDIQDENELSFDGGLLRDEKLHQYRGQFEIREYHDGLRIFTTDRDDKLVYAERYTKSFEQLVKERRDLDLIKELQRQVFGIK